MTSKFTELAIDCADPNGLARFWCSVLDYEVQDEDDGIVTIGSPMVPEGKNHLGPVPPTLTFAHVPEGKTVKNRLHLDVNPTDREQGEEGAACSTWVHDTPTSTKAMSSPAPSTACGSTSTRPSRWDPRYGAG